MRSAKSKLLHVLFFLGLLLMCRAAVAGELADRKLLEILESKGFLNRQEVETIKEILVKEEAEDARQQTQLMQQLENDVEVVFEDGLHIRTKDKKTFTNRIGGVIQSDAILFDNHYPVDNDFDIRRARISMQGRLYEFFSYKLEAELEGSSSNRLIDAYINYDYYPFLQIRLGQFKEPFGLEQLTSDKYLPFNERSMAHYLTPVRDVGLMIHGVVLDETIQYALGIFNGDGRDAERRDQKDDKEIAGRLVLQPFRKWGPSLLKGLHIGGSYAFARLDTSDFNFAVRTPARTKFFTVQARAKFHMTQEVDALERYGFEFAYSCGPLVLMAEYIRAEFRDVRLSDTTQFDFDMRGWYAGFLLMLTGEKPSLEGGVLQKIRPHNNFDPRKRNWGAWGIGFRYQEFEAGRVVYRSLVNQGFSIRETKAFTLGINWYLNAMMRVTLNYSHTKFEDPLYLGTHWKGYSYYEDSEHAWITRFQLEF